MYKKKITQEWKRNLSQKESIGLQQICREKEIFSLTRPALENDRE